MSRRPLFLALALAVLPAAAQADDLLQSYQKARESDPTYAAAESNRAIAAERPVQARAVVVHPRRLEPLTPGRGGPLAVGDGGRRLAHVDGGSLIHPLGGDDERGYSIGRSSSDTRRPGKAEPPTSRRAME